MPEENPPTVWMESIRPHTYLGKPQPVGAVYLAHEEQVENIENLKFAKRIASPPKAVRTPAPTPPPDAPKPGTPVAPMTTTTVESLRRARRFRP